LPNPCLERRRTRRRTTSDL